MLLSILGNCFIPDSLVVRLKHIQNGNNGISELPVDSTLSSSFGVSLIGSYDSLCVLNHISRLVSLDSKASIVFSCGNCSIAGSKIPFTPAAMILSRSWSVAVDQAACSYHAWNPYIDRALGAKIEGRLRRTCFLNKDRPILKYKCTH